MVVIAGYALATSKSYGSKINTCIKVIIQIALYTVYGKPPYKKNEEAKLVEVDQSKGYTIDFKTEKGKTYTIVPL